MYSSPLTSCALRALLLLAFGAILTGCASGLSKDECQVVDWHAIGYEDAVRGWSQTRVGHHRKACARHGVALDLGAYRQGWEEGAERYCQPGNGYRQGRSGSRYPGICPAALEPAFLDAYNSGRELYQLEAAVQHTTRALHARHSRLADIEIELRDTGLDLIAPGISTEQRLVLLDELRKLERERAANQRDIPALEEQLAMQQASLSAQLARAPY